jgi:hypothetical protein
MQACFFQLAIQLMVCSSWFSLENFEPAYAYANAGLIPGRLFARLVKGRRSARLLFYIGLG